MSPAIAGRGRLARRRRNLALNCFRLNRCRQSLLSLLLVLRFLFRSAGYDALLRLRSGGPNIGFRRSFRMLQLRRRRALLLGRFGGRLDG